MTTPQNLPTEPREAIEELTLILLYLTRFAWNKNQEMRSSWKSYDWDAMDHDVGLKKWTSRFVKEIRKRSTYCQLGFVS